MTIFIFVNTLVVASNNKKAGYNQAGLFNKMVGMQGLEPRTNEPESSVLPITPHPNGTRNSVKLLYYKNGINKAFFPKQSSCQVEGVF